MPGMALGIEEPWRWYYIDAEFYAAVPNSHAEPLKNTKLHIRMGTAQVILDDKNVRIKFQDSELPAQRAEYVGGFIHNNPLTTHQAKFEYKTMSGAFNSFYFENSLQWQGTFRKIQQPDCVFEEISLQSDVPNGSRIVLLGRRVATLLLMMIS